MKLKDIVQAENIIFNNKNMGNMHLMQGYKMMAHYHSRLEIMLLISGSLEIIFFDKDYNRRDSVVIRKGQFILIEENVKHDINVLQDTVMLNLEFTVYSSSYNTNAINNKNFLMQFSVFKSFCSKFQDFSVSTDTVNLKETILRIHNTYFDSAINQEISYLNDLLILSFLIDVAKCHLPEKSLTNNYHINRAIQLLNSNLTKNISTEFLADKIGINKSYLQRIFKEHTGKTIVYYLNELRIKNAKKLLANKNFNIIDIAFEVGFNNRQNFAVAFKKFVGKTPSEYRRLVSNKEYTTY